jgi:hypothetical protein
MTWAAFITWLVTAGSGFVLSIWLARGRAGGRASAVSLLTSRNIEEGLR